MKGTEERSNAPMMGTDGIKNAIFLNHHHQIKTLNSEFLVQDFSDITHSIWPTIGNECQTHRRVGRTTKMTLKIPKESLNENYNQLKTQLIKGYDIFTFEMKRDSLDVCIELHTSDVETTLEFLCSMHEPKGYQPETDHEEPDVLNNSGMNYVENTQTTGFTRMNYLLMKILHFKTCSEILKKHRCRTKTVVKESLTHLIISGPDRRTVNCCRREFEELYYSNVLIEIGKVDSPEHHRFTGKTRDVVEEIRNQPVRSEIFIEISNMNDGSVVVFGRSNEIPVKYMITARYCTVNLTVNFEMGYYICGKKMGKIHKIGSPYLHVSMIGNSISLNSPVVSFSFRIQGPVKDCMKCYTQLFDEFPFEMCFNVDRRYHKKIIGTEGNAIKNIMKKYNFYVKFLSFKEMSQLGLEGNVILKTPRKNKGVLEDAKREIQGRIREDAKPAGAKAEGKKGNEFGGKFESEGSFENISMFVEMNMQKEKWY